ncbi:MAG: phytochelatin synthase family protein [Proteobacteria bacterium]|nr:phytochelatin synthase family protein [Pseudomonadota bacterium]
MHLRRLKIFLAIGYQSLKYRLINRQYVAKPVSVNPVASHHELSHRSKFLLVHYVHQFNDAACSVATVATVLNAIMDMNHGNSHHTISQKEILNTVRVVDWKERIMPSGRGTKRGLPLKELGIAVENTLKTYKISFEKISVTHLDHKDLDWPVERETLLNRLTAFEQSDNQYMIAHFNQGIFLKGLHLPHISPVGAFKVNTKEVLVLDVDKDGPGPYWVPFDVFFKGLSNDFNGKLADYGYTGGGYVQFQLNLPPK